MRGWKDLEVVETIYEEDQEEEEEDGSIASSVLLTPSLSFTPSPPHSSSPPPSLQTRVEAWTNATGSQTDVVIRVQDQCFHLHKDLLVTRSGYLKRKLTESSDVTVSPPSGITVDAFSEIAAFCYGSDEALTPSGLAAVWAAADWMEMERDSAMEGYFRREIAGDVGNAELALRGSLEFLGGTAEAAAAELAARCVEVLASDGGGGEWMDDVARLSAEEFGLVAHAMREWFAHDHDLLYRIVDDYLEKDNGNLKEEEKIRLCYTVDCAKLSDETLVHLVQNPRLPLRFVVQAMLVDQLHARHSILSKKKPISTTNPTGQLSLGAILQRDAALRQGSQLRASLEATSFRIESLERELSGLRRRLRWSEEKIMKPRSESFRFARRDEETAIVPASNSTMSGGRGLGRRLMHGLRSVFRTSTAEEQERRPGHRRNRSFA